MSTISRFIFTDVWFAEWAEMFLAILMTPLSFQHVWRMNSYILIKEQPKTKLVLQFQYYLR